MARMLFEIGFFLRSRLLSDFNKCSIAVTSIYTDLLKFVDWTQNTASEFVYMQR